MRALPARRIASSALCATLLLGIAAPAAIAADSDSARGRSAAAAPVPGADALLAQVQSLADIGTVLTPVTDLLNAALKADDGQLSADQAATLGQAVKDAIAKLTAVAPVTPPVSVPEVPASCPRRRRCRLFPRSRPFLRCRPFLRFRPFPRCPRATRPPRTTRLPLRAVRVPRLRRI